MTLKANEFEGTDADAHDDNNDGDIPPMDPATALTVWSDKLELARGGTLYIEEVGALPADIQLPLLRELQLHDIEAAAGQSPARRVVPAYGSSYRPATTSRPTWIRGASGPSSITASARFA